MPELPSWDERLLALMRKPGQWVTVESSTRRLTVENARRKVLYLSTEREMDRAHISARIIDHEDGTHDLQLRWLWREPRALGRPSVTPVVDTGQKPLWSQTHPIKSVTVTPGVVQHAKSWRAGPSVVLLSGEALHSTIHWALPEPVARSLRYSLNMIFGDPSEELTSVNDTTSNVTDTDITVTVTDKPETQEQAS